MALIVKICGLSTGETLEAAIEAGADMVGFVLVEASPRFPGYARAGDLAKAAAGRAKTVALLVDPSYHVAASGAALVAADYVQFHGSADPNATHPNAETPGRLRTMRDVVKPAGLIKAIGVAGPDDLAPIDRYVPVADLILLDAKPPKDAAYPGGHGRPFDWSVLQRLAGCAGKFMLSGGLRPENVADAVRTVRDFGVNLAAVDVSSGVESAPGVKDVGRIREFMAAAREADRRSHGPHPTESPTVPPLSRQPR